MNEIKIFENNEFGQIRIMEKDGEPWFVGKDVANISTTVLVPENISHIFTNKPRLTVFFYYPNLSELAVLKYFNFVHGYYSPNFTHLKTPCNLQGALSRFVISHALSLSETPAVVGSTTIPTAASMFMNNDIN